MHHCLSIEISHSTASGTRCPLTAAEGVIKVLARTSANVNLMRAAAGWLAAAQKRTVGSRGRRGHGPAA